MCRIRYPSVRDLILQSHPWRFASKRVELAPTLAVAAPAGYTHVFQLPSDFGRRISLTDRSGYDLNTDREGNYVFANASAAVLVYVRNFDSTNDGFTFPDDFAEAVSAYLAADLCMSVMNDQSLRDTYLQAYEVMLAQARHNGSIDRTDVAIESSEWLESRHGLMPEDPPFRKLRGY